MSTIPDARRGVSRGELEQLGKALRSEATDDSGRLRSLGLLEQDLSVPPSVAPIASALAQPLGRLQLLQTNVAGTTCIDIWLGRGQVVVHPFSDLGEPEPALVAVPAVLPGLLAILTGLGPRRSAGVTRFRSSLEEVLVGLADAQPVSWLEGLTLAKDASLWRLRHWAAGGAQDVLVLDLAEQGVLLGQQSQGMQVEWAPVTAGQVWEALASLVGPMLAEAGS